jgi:hypothetical protein
MLILKDSGLYCNVSHDNHKYLTLKPHFSINSYTFSTKVLNSAFDRS